VFGGRRSAYQRGCCRCGFIMAFRLSGVFRVFFLSGLAPGIPPDVGDFLCFACSGFDTSCVIVFCFFLCFFFVFPQDGETFLHWKIASAT